MIKEIKNNPHTKVRYNILDVKDKYELKDGDSDNLDNYVWLSVEKQSDNVISLGDYDLEVYQDE